MSDAAPPRQKWRLSQEAFDSLLSALGSDRDQAAQRYEKIRTRLIKYFSWERCDTPEDCADETINRVAKRVSEGEFLNSPESYFSAVARLVARESALAAQRHNRAMDEMARTRVDDPSIDEAASHQLERCLQGLTPDQRKFLLEYYQGEQRTRIDNRRRMAERLGLPLNAVRNRALRLREKIENCMSVIFQPDASLKSRRIDG